MEKEVYGYIYKIENTVNGKVYIGLTTNGFDKRYKAKGEGIERVYNYYVRQRKYRQFYNIHLLRSIEKYGFEAFEVVKEFDTAYSEEELKEKERYWISFYKCNDINYGYNRTEGGDSFLKGEDNPNYKKRTTFKCGYCGKKIKKLESNIRDCKNTFCSKECLKKWQSEQRKGKDSPTYKGFLVIYPDGKISEEMTQSEVANYLNVSMSIISDLAREKTCYIGNYECIRYIRVLHLEDYLKEREIYKSDEYFRNMCKHMVEEAEILYKNKKEEFKKKMGEVGIGTKNGNAKILVCIFPDGNIIKDVSIRELSEELKITEGLVSKILNSKQPYKVPKTLNKSNYERLKRLEGIVIIEQKDYLNINEISEVIKGVKNGNTKSLVCIFPNGRIIKDMCIKELAKELKITEDLVRKILKLKQPYKVSKKTNKKNLEHLKPLEGIIIMEEKDYLDMLKNTNINKINDKAS